MTLQEQYEAAQKELAAWERRWDNYDGNNPNKYQGQIKAARNKVGRIAAQIALAEFTKVNP
jgi:hypothetical protein